MWEIVGDVAGLMVLLLLLPVLFFVIQLVLNPGWALLLLLTLFAAITKNKSLLKRIKEQIDEMSKEEEDG